MASGASLRHAEPAQAVPQIVQALQDLLDHQSVEECKHGAARIREVQPEHTRKNSPHGKAMLQLELPWNQSVHRPYTGESFMPVRVEPMMVTTSIELPGYRIVRNFGIVRGIIVRSRSLLGSIGAGLQTILGGNITLLTELCENTREEAFELMMQHAAEHGANAVISMRYDATEIMQGVTEVLAYGTAVIVERIPQ
jgi:uncharacterized protein YbjQ (UPF0145 family)